MPTYDTVVIVGYGIAGMTAADTLRSEGFSGHLIIVGAEPSEPYSRPALSKAMMSAEANQTPQFLPPSTHGAEVLLGRSAVALDRHRRLITLDDGTSVAYDGLVIATGSAARRFTDDPREFVVRGADDAAALRSRLADRPRVAVLGGGPLGMEVASGARELGCAVTLVHRGRPMARHLGPYFAQLCSRAAEDNGVALIDDTVTEVVTPTDPDAAVTVHLTETAPVVADIVVSTIGDRPSDDWLAESGLLTDGQLLVDDCGRVCPADPLASHHHEAENIVAAGDVAWHPAEDGHRRSPLWTSAIEGAKAAARTLLSGEESTPLDYSPYFWTEQFGLNIRVSGQFPIDGEPEVVSHGQARDPDALLLKWDDGENRSAAAVNYRIPIPRLRKIAQGTEPAA